VKHQLVGRPNKPPPADLDAERLNSDRASRTFTSPAMGNAFQQPAPQNAGHSYNPANPRQYQKVK
jgi:hypothetical protein